MPKKISSMIVPATYRLAVVLLLAVTTTWSLAFPRYYNDNKDDGSNCSQCHGAFTDSTSPKGTVFPGGSKHVMHGRENTYMDTECDLCHTTGDNHNPFTDSSNGTANNTGLGCSGCHVGPGLRAHHVANGFNCTALCHSTDPEPDPESSVPPYYGTADTLVQNPCNDVLLANTNENWSVGDLLGMDNDGDNLYDQADFDCGPRYKLVSAVREGDNIRVTWETMGGRTDALQSSGGAADGYSDVGASIAIPGVGPVTTNLVEVGGATHTNRFYRVRYAP